MRIELWTGLGAVLALAACNGGPEGAVGFEPIAVGNAAEINAIDEGLLAEDADGPEVEGIDGTDGIITPDS